MKYEFDLARSFMTSTRKKKFYHPHIILSILGIAVGVGFLVFALSLYDGYVKKIETIIFSFYPQITLQTDTLSQDPDTNDDWILKDEDVDDRCRKVCNGDIIMEDQTITQDKSSQKKKFDLKAFEPVKKKLQTVKGIRQVSPIILEESEFICTYYNGHEDVSHQGPLRVLGVQPGDNPLTFAPEIERTITDPSLLKKLSRQHDHYVILSQELYQKLSENNPGKLNHPIETIFLEPKNNADTQITNHGNIIELKVAGVFKLGMHQISENMMITSVATAQKIFSMPGEATFVGVSLTDPYQAESIADAIKKKTKKDNIQVYHWMAVAADMFNSLSFYRNIVIIVLLMSVLITAFNIYTTLNIMILERKKQIGVLMAMGIKRSSLYRTFLIISQKEALFGIGFGILAGLIPGYFFSEYFNRSIQAFVNIQDTGVLLDPWTVLFIFVFVCLVCGLTAFAATHKGVAMQPVEALRSE